MNRFTILLSLFIGFGLSQPATALSQKDLLPADQAFALTSEIEDHHIVLTWNITEGYYLYRKKLRFKSDDAFIKLNDLQLPAGTIKRDSYFGEVETYRRQLKIIIPFDSSTSQPFVLTVKSQGCADAGICYPPMKKQLTFHPTGLQTQKAQPMTMASIENPPLAEQDRIALALQKDTLAWTVLSFFGFGVLLAFTPCCLPMIPILSGIIVGQGGILSTSRAFFLSLTYVIASALTYTVFGVLAGLFGSNLQTVFQNPWIIGAFSSVFVLLALSMFGFYQLQMPTFIQAKVSGLSNRQQSGSLFGVGVMGVLSALIVGPCVAAPLAGALIYIGQSGDAVLGGIALFVMGLGMGAPLLVVGTSAGKLLPKAGTWMESVKTVFGVLLLAVAIWLLSRIVPASVSLVLWALLLIIPAIYLGAIDALPTQANGWHKMRKGIGVVCLLYGSALFIGVLSGSNDPLQPLKGIAGNANALQSSKSIAFTRIQSTTQLDQQLQKAVSDRQWVMLDFYADWCVSCIEMEHETFSDSHVQKALQSLKLVQVDVTGNNDQDKQLLKRFGLIGPPAILFFNPDGLEQRAFRTAGFKKPNEFLQSLETMKAIY